MDFNKDVIKKSCRAYIIAHERELDFKMNGEYVNAKFINGFDVDLVKGDYGDGFNFSCRAFNLKVGVDNSEFPCMAEFVIKVEQTRLGQDEEVVAIKNNLITLRKY
jgi:hypothetical protein